MCPIFNLFAESTNTSRKDYKLKNRTWMMDLIPTSIRINLVKSSKFSWFSFLPHKEFLFEYDLCFQNEIYHREAILLLFNKKLGSLKKIG